MIRPAILDVIDCATLDARPPVQLPLPRPEEDPEPPPNVEWEAKALRLLRESPLTVLTLAIAVRAPVSEVQQWCRWRQVQGVLAQVGRGAKDPATQSFRATTRKP